MNQNHSDNGGFRTSPHPGQSQPVITQTALQLTNGTKDTDTEATVVGGKRYRITALVTGGLYLGLADVTTAANVRWAVPLGATAEIQIPYGQSTLHYATDTNSAIGYLVEIKQAEEDDVSA